jgi:hypothetical protein
MAQAAPEKPSNEHSGLGGPQQLIRESGETKNRKE